MKKTVKKLSLSRETLRSLDEELVNAEGGAFVSGQYSRCNQSCGIACTVRQLSCTCPVEE
jgi:hypothetical protein